VASVLHVSKKALWLTLPFPPSELNPNRSRGLHWSQRSRVTRDYREEVAWYAYAYCNHGKNGKTQMLRAPVKAVVTFVVPDRRPRDMDNLLASLKAAWDGLVDARILEGDDASRFAVERSEIRYEKGQRYVEVSLEESTDG